MHIAMMHRWFFGRPRTTLFFAFLLLASACDDRCSDDLLGRARPIDLRELAVETAAGELLWKFRANGHPLSQIRYGHLPPNAEQLFPERGVPPRLFFLHERIIIRVYSTDAFFFIHGSAGGPRVFCGGVYEAGPRSNLKAHEQSLKRLP